MAQEGKEQAVTAFTGDQLRQIANMSKLEAERQMGMCYFEAAAASFDLAADACRFHGDPRKAVQSDA